MVSGTFVASGGATRIDAMEQSSSVETHSELTTAHRGDRVGKTITPCHLDGHHDDEEGSHDADEEDGGHDDGEDDDDYDD